MWITLSNCAKSDILLAGKHSCIYLKIGVKVMRSINHLSIYENTAITPL